METTRSSRLVALYAGTIFLSAFLLFQIQPLISRFILPWFGGTQAVWTTCLVFFQTMLFAGYAYAHVSEHTLRPPTRTIVHLVLIGTALLTLPIAPSDWWKPVDGEYPTARILALLAVCVGLPYFVLSSTGPLVQAWFSQTLPGRSPYRLYSLSNLGSLLALLSYPFVVEPLLGGNAQSWCWTGGFVLFGTLCGTACWKTARLRHGAEAAAQTAKAAGKASTRDGPAPSWMRRLLWLALPAFASVLLLATTNHLCLDMPSVPFLWVAPLSLYLVSFIIAFDHQRWYQRLPYALAALIAVYLTAGLQNPRVWGAGWLGHVHRWFWNDASTAWTPALSYRAQILWQLGGLFALCMLCHGELVRLRPAPRYLTSFYLMIAAGGALGGLLVSFVAPLVFNTYAEWKIGLVAGFVLAAVVAFVLARSAGWRRPHRSGWIWLRAGGVGLALLALCEIVPLLQKDILSNLVIMEQARNFYAVMTVTSVQQEPPLAPFRLLFSDSTIHGMQFTPAQLQAVATSYYSDTSGVGHALTYYEAESARTNEPLRVGAIGLGVGTLAAYVRDPRHTIRFYEINPEVCRLAKKYFTFLSGARERGAAVELVLGDARLSLERELSKPQAFNLLVVDAFSSDSIPIHLLTKEAFEIYLAHLAPGGAIAVHVSNRHLDLNRVVYGLAESFGLDGVQVFTNDAARGGGPSEWVIFSRNQGLLENLRAVKDNTAPPAPGPPLPLWTDQHHNLLEVLR